MSVIEHRARTTERVGVDQALLDRAHLLRERAEHLRRQADQLDGVLATTFRRRASEIELEAWANELRSGIPVDEVHGLAA